MKTAIIGLGIMGRRMLEHMLRHDAFDPALLFDPNPEACAEALKIAPDATITDSAEAAIAGADLVYLACPPGPRKALALAVAKAGKPVFLEKPLGVDVGESRDLVARMAAFGTPAAVNFTQAASPAMIDTVTAAKDGTLGDLMGIDIIVTYAAWPRAWQAAADWLRFRDEGGMTREVISHFLFFSERVLGPLTLDWARPAYPADPALCETHMLARLTSATGVPVSVMASVGGAQPDRQELTIKGSRESRRITDFYVDWASTGGDFTLRDTTGGDPRGPALRGQLDNLAAMSRGDAHRLATLDEALRVQVLIEAMLQG
ncbi:Gfo/Idh/MocA family protein [Rhodalgimonas zhirmunskyi]|uniref:Gfo/Idh/MocA family oxidoreductase n=1 Tax=Rhodalgimonas zhirmunskyi TaxID=2964767 RepID=A0AAJ1UDP7_9RHOB|nr:Gfo/Idh/MocA family oxidoreductase [Rhodoalgimonas zhirmunskyi]MDQ2095628.1 Gfo/Idh/MocA family oxidoreductase [Rhodoalgimonas zhirmunskyi]